MHQRPFHGIINATPMVTVMAIRYFDWMCVT